MHAISSFSIDMSSRYILSQKIESPKISNKINMFSVWRNLQLDFLSFQNKIVSKAEDLNLFLGVYVLLTIFFPYLTFNGILAQL